MSPIILLGHITHDHILTPSIDLHLPGGTAWYAAWCLHHLLAGSSAPVPFHLITSVGPADQSSLDALTSVGIPVHNLPSPATVFFENRYGANMNNRQQRVLSKALPFTWSSLQPLLQSLSIAGPSAPVPAAFPAGSSAPIPAASGPVPAAPSASVPAASPAGPSVTVPSAFAEGLCASRPIFLLGSLLADDFPLSLIRELHALGTVVVDVQGYLREVVGEEVHPTDWPEKVEALRYVDILKTNEHEMEVLTGHTDPLLAARQLAAWGVKEVLLTMGDKGSIIYSEGEAVQIPAYKPEPLVDATGCGDTYTTAYLLRRAQGASLYDAGCFAAATATLKLQHSGPFQSTPAAVLSLISASR